MPTFSGCSVWASKTTPGLATAESPVLAVPPLWWWRRRPQQLLLLIITLNIIMQWVDMLPDIQKTSSGKEDQLGIGNAFIFGLSLSGCSQLLHPFLHLQSTGRFFLLKIYLALLSRRLSTGRYHEASWPVPYHPVSTMSGDLRGCHTCTSISLQVRWSLCSGYLILVFFNFSGSFEVKSRKFINNFFFPK